MISKFKNIVLMSAVLFSASQQVQADAHIKSHKQVECLSVMAYHEAKGESKQGILAVMHTTLNRVRDSRFPNSVCSVVYQKGQYSWSKHNPKIRDYETFNKIKSFAYDVVKGKYNDNTEGSLYFNSLHKRPKGTVQTVRIDGHTFYRPI